MTDPAADAAKLLPLFRYDEFGNHGTGLNVGTEEGHVASCENAELADELVRCWNTRPQPASPADNVEVEIYLHSKELAQTIADHTYWFCDICSNTHDECLCHPDALERGKKEIEHTLVDYGRHMYRLGLAERPKVEDMSMTDLKTTEAERKRVEEAACNCAHKHLHMPTVNPWVCDDAALTAHIVESDPDFVLRLLADLRTKETQLAQADANIARADAFMRSKGVRIAPGVYGHWEESLVRHQSRQQAAKDKP